MGAPTAYPMPPMMAAEPPEVQSIKSMLHIVRILAIIFGILLALGGIAYAAFLAYAFSVCGSYGAYCSGSLGFALIPAIFIIIFGVIDFIIYMQMKDIEALVNQHQYEQAKSKTLLWMVLGFILGGIILGVLLLIAYLKFDPVINWQRSGSVTPGYAPQYAAPPPAAPPPAPAAAPAAPVCPKCGRPTTYIAQYGRYYCYTDNLYV